MKKYILGMLIIYMTACSGGGGGSGANLPSTGGGTSGAGGSINDIASAASGWTGVFCSQGTGVQTGDIISASGNSIMITTGSFDDGSNCNAANLFRADKVTYSAVASGTNATETTATNLNITVSKVEIKPINAGAVADFNTGSLCGFNDWQLNTYKDVSNTSCGSSVGTTYYTIFKISGNSLFIGKAVGGNDATTEAKRHTTLDAANYYAK